MKKMGFVILAVVIALGAIGAGYAAWSQTLNIGATVNAATFDVEFTSSTVPATLPIGGAATNVIATGGESAAITLTNAYPNYTGAYTLVVTNKGTVPVTLAINEVDDDGSIFSVSSDPTGSIAAGGTYTYTITALVPDWTGTTNSGSTFTANYTVTAAQATTTTP